MSVVLHFGSEAERDRARESLPHVFWAHRVSVRSQPVHRSAAWAHRGSGAVGDSQQSRGGESCGQQQHSVVAILAADH